MKTKLRMFIEKYEDARIKSHEDGTEVLRMAYEYLSKPEIESLANYCYRKSLEENPPENA